MTTNSLDWGASNACYIGTNQNGHTVIVHSDEDGLTYLDYLELVRDIPEHGYPILPQNFAIITKEEALAYKEIHDAKRRAQGREPSVIVLNE